MAMSVRMWQIFWVILIILVTGTVFLLNDNGFFDQSYGTPSYANGIRGTATLGPTCPVERNPPDPTCADQPYHASLTVTTADGQHVVGQFDTDVDGTFSVGLPPGEYAIRSTSISNVRPYCSSRGTIRVSAGTYTIANVSCDTGIR